MAPKLPRLKKTRNPSEIKPPDLPEVPTDVLPRIPPPVDLPHIVPLPELPEALQTRPKLVIGMLGWAAESIDKGESKFCHFPTGDEDPRYRDGRVWERTKVTAIDDIRANTDVFIIDDKRHVQEYSQLSLLKETSILSNTDNIKNKRTEKTPSIKTAGYNKVAGFIYADQDLTVYVDQSIDGKNWDEVTEAKNYTSESNDCAFSVEVVAPFVRIRIVNNSGTDTKKCRKFTQLSAGL